MSFIFRWLSIKQYGKIIMQNKIYDLFPNTKTIDLRNQFFWLMSQENTSCLNETAKSDYATMNKRKKNIGQSIS